MSAYRFSYRVRYFWAWEIRERFALWLAPWLRERLKHGGIGDKYQR